jgi:hypothetical protein
MMGGRSYPLAPFPGAGRGPVAPPIGIDRSMRPICQHDWAPAFAGEGSIL